jgi:uncharacterized delta-60 repeat protein
LRNLDALMPIDRLAWQPGYGLLVAGSLHQVNPSRHGRIFRVDLQGNIDPTFTFDTFLGYPITGLLVLPDKSILVANRGVPISVTEVGHPPLVLKLLPNGTIDPSFNVPLSAIGELVGAEAIHLLEDGRILVAGQFAINGSPMGKLRRLIRLLPTGEIDSTYEEPSNVTNAYSVNGVFPIQDGLIVAKRSGPGGLESAVRIHSDGTEDSRYPNNILAKLQWWIAGILPMPDGNLLVASTDPGLTRIGPDGVVDAKFPARGTGGIRQLLPLPDGGYFACGNLQKAGDIPRPGFVRIRPDGTPDENFGRMGPTSNFGAESSPITNLIALHDGILIGGNFLTVDGVRRNPFAKLHLDGSLDPRFGTSTINTNWVTRSPATFAKGSGLELDDHRIVLAGSSGFYSGSNNLGPIIRLMPDGTIDWAFRPALRIGSPIVTLAKERDESILILGVGLAEQHPGGASILRIRRDGVIDPDFQSILPKESPFNALFVLRDGRILAATVSGKVYRFDSQGVLDPTFSLPPSAIVRQPTFAELASGDLYISGYSQRVGRSVRNLAHWNPDGSFDNQFRFIYPGVVDQVVAVEPNRILVRGSMSTGLGLPAKLFRCFADGSLDPSFTINRDAQSLTAMATLGDRIYVAGRQSIPGLPPVPQLDHVASYFNAVFDFTPPVVNESPTTRVNFNFFAPPGGHYQFESSPDLSNWAPFGSATVPTNGVLPLTDEPPTNSQNRFYRARSID